MNAASIAQALGGRRTGRTWMACCPAHDDKTPSLAIRDGVDGKVLVKCHAGCSQEAVIDALRRKGLWEEPQPFTRGRKVQTYPAFTNDPDSEKRSDFARSIWASARPIAGSVVETYLASRGLRLPEGTALRFQPRLSHPSGGTWPTMVALVARGTDRVPLGIHRTFLRPDGSGKAPVVSQKMMLGPCRGGAVRLGTSTEGLLVGEGIETCLAAMQAIGRPAWAALSTSGLRSLDLPDDIRDVTILADGDPPGEMAAQHAARRWLREGRRVRIARAPVGMDFNDVLLAGNSKAAGGCR
jgi:hypothetical protein